MKNILIAIIAFLSTSDTLFAQNINWRAFKAEQKQIIHIAAGFDYGFIAGVGYGYKVNTRMPIFLNIEYSFPSGKTLIDDFKTRIGGQMEVVNIGRFSATIKAYCPFRRFENTQARVVSFGSEFSAVAGYYRPRWFVSGEFGFDKAIVTHIKHSERAVENTPTLQKGWYVPTAGNYFYGLQTGFAFAKNDFSLKAGRIVSQGFKTTPLIPFFAQVGYSRRF